MEQTELSIENARLDKARAYARERMRAKRAADPEGSREYMRAWKKANAEKIKARTTSWKIESGEIYKERRRESKQRWHAKNPDYLRAWKAANPEKVRAWYEGNIEKIKMQTKRNALKRIYGLTLKQRDDLFAKQDHRCAVCKSAEPGTTKNWHIDHCHETNRVRGILCNHCNLMLGYAKDNETTLANAIEYLRKNALQVGYGAS
jgi:Uri superfamily endonuclease